MCSGPGLRCRCGHPAKADRQGVGSPQTCAGGPVIEGVPRIALRQTCGRIFGGRHWVPTEHLAPLRRVRTSVMGCTNLPRRGTDTRSSKRTNDVSLSISVANSELPSPDAFSFSSSMTTGRRLPAVRYESPRPREAMRSAGGTSARGQVSAIIRMSSIKRDSGGCECHRMAQSATLIPLRNNAPRSRWSCYSPPHVAF